MCNATGNRCKVKKVNLTNYTALPACVTIGKSKDSPKARRACREYTTSDQPCPEVVESVSCLGQAANSRISPSRHILLHIALCMPETTLYQSIGPATTERLIIFPHQPYFCSYNERCSPIFLVFLSPARYALSIRLRFAPLTMLWYNELVPGVVALWLEKAWNLQTILFARLGLPNPSLCLAGSTR